MKFMVFRGFIVNSVSLSLSLVVVVCLILKEIFTRYHSDQRALSGREEDVTVNIGAFSGGHC